MLQNIHNKTQGWVAYAFAIVIAVIFGFWGIEYYISGGNSKTKSVAKVNGQAITQAELGQAAKQQTRMQLQMTGKAPTSAEQARIKQQAFSELVNTALLQSAANKAGLAIGNNQIAAAITQMPAFQENGQFSQQRFAQILQANQMTESQLMGQMAQNMLLQQLQQGILTSAFATQSEVKSIYALQNQTRDIGFFTVAAKQYLSATIPTQAQIKAYYKSHSKEFITPEKISVEYLMLTPDAVKKTIKYSADDMKNYYQQNIALYSTPKQWHVSAMSFKTSAQATAFTAALANGKTFKAQASTVKQKPLSETITQGKSAMPLVQMLAQLQIGQVSRAVKTDAGYAVYHLDSITAPKPQAFSDVKDKVHNALVQQKAQQKYNQLSDQLSNLTYTNASSLEPAASTMELSIKTSPLFAKTGGKGLFANSNIVAAAFSQDVLQSKNNSNLIELKNGTVMVLRMKQHEQSSVKTLNSVEPQIAKLLNQSAAASKAQTVAQKVLVQLQAGADPHALASQMHLTWTLKPGVKRGEKGVAPAVLDGAFKLPPLASGKPASAMATEINGDVAVLSVLARHDADADAVTPAELKGLASAASTGNGQYDFAVLMLSLRDSATIKIMDPSLHL